MDAQTAAALANSVAHLNLLYLMASLFIVCGAFGAIVWLGERAFGLDLEKFIDAVEEQANKGNVWPGIVGFIVTPACLLGVVFWVSLR